MLRPGNLNGIKTIRSKGARKHLGLGNFAHMGVFGKSAYVAAPAPGSPCPSGSTMVNEACQGDDCCDAPGDCDPPGTVYKECIASAPKPVAKRVAPRPAPVAAARSAAPQGPGDSAEQQALEAELFSLELDAQQGVIPEAGPAPVYTGGGSPGYIPLPRGGSKGPQTTQEKVLSIIAERQPARTRARVAPTRVEMDMPPPAVETSQGGIFNWIRSALFGPQESSGLGDFDVSMSPLVKISLAAGVAYVVYRNLN
jgi:hypothetical protein